MRPTTATAPRNLPPGGPDVLVPEAGVKQTKLDLVSREATSPRHIEGFVASMSLETIPFRDAGKEPLYPA